jgi:hypothetical protein
MFRNEEVEGTIFEKKMAYVQWLNALKEYWIVKILYNQETKQCTYIKSDVNRRIKLQIYRLK